MIFGRRIFLDLSSSKRLLGHSLYYAFDQKLYFSVYGSGSGWIRIIWPDPDPFQETLIGIRVANNKS